MEEDSALRALQRAKEEVLLSSEWEELNQELLRQLRRSEAVPSPSESRRDSNGGGFRGLSSEEKSEAVRRAARELEKTKAYGHLQDKVSSTLDRHFCPPLTPAQPSSSSMAPGPSSLSQQQSSRRHEYAPPSGGVPTLNIASACCHLLTEHPHFKHHLKKCLNHPLPPELRATVWRLSLKHPVARHEFLSRVGPNGSFLESVQEERRIGRRCEALLSSNPVFRDISESVGVLRAMKSIVCYWRKRCGRTLQDTDILLCVPFLYMRRRELSRWDGEFRASESTSSRGRPLGEGSRSRSPLGCALVAEIGEQYTSFMEMLPLAMQTAATPETQAAMTQFTLQVEGLLSSEDWKLSQSLFRAFGYHDRSPEGANPHPYLERLKSTLHPHVQRMMVGVVSMDLVCFIWDQCLIGIDNPGYQCLPYLVTSWLILLRERLIQCHSVRDVEKTLLTNSEVLRVRDFQEKIEKHFLEKLSSLLGTVPTRLKAISRRQTPSRETVVDKPKELDPFTGVYQSPRGRSGDSEKEMLRKKVIELERQLEREKRATIKLPPSGSDATNTTGIASNPTGITVLSPLGSGYVVSPVSPLMSPVSPDSRFQLSLPFAIQNTPLLPQQPSTSAEQKSGINKKGRPFSPSKLTNRDVEDIWMTILKRFKDAADLVCHGDGDERQQLCSTLREAEENR